MDGRTGLCQSRNRKERTTYLNTSDILRRVFPYYCPAFAVASVRLGRADANIFENAGEEFKVGQLDGVDPDILAKLDNNKVPFFIELAW